MSLDGLQRMLTHRSQSSTAIYAHTDVEDLREELERAGMLGDWGAIVIAAATADQLARPSLERLLLAAVRLEFRGEVFVAPRGSSLLGSGCEVAGCTGYEHYRPWGRASGRAPRELHGLRWLKRGATGGRGAGGAGGAATGAVRSSAVRIAGCARSVYVMHRCGGHLRHAEVVSIAGEDECLVSGCAFPTGVGQGAV